MTVVMAIAGVGAFFSWWPTTPAKQDSRAEHAREMKLREIAERFAQGTVMLHAKQYEYALAAFHRVLELDPALPEAHVNAGFALVGLKRYAAARDFFAGAIELRPMQVNAYYGLAVAQEGLGDLPAARGAMRTYAHLAPRDDPYRRKAEAALWEWESADAGKH
jgi:tetratricopeptide (TPR) repeat protein